jgi:hypothetical protein
VEYNEVLKNYMGTYNLCLECLKNSQKIKIGIAKTKLEMDIEKEYPGLIKKMNKMLKNPHELNFINRIQTEIFCLSPILYYYFGKIKKIINNQKYR